MFSWVYAFLIKYQQIMDTLSLEQLVAVFNILGFSILLMSLISICFIFMGKNIIHLLILEE
jgi:hypothetical protein